MQFKHLDQFKTGGSGTEMQLSIPPPRTPDGRVYRLSPNEKAQPRHFVLGAANNAVVVSDAARVRMKLEPRSKKTVCPYSGIIGDDQDFTHPDDINAAVEIVKHAAIADARAEIARILKGIENSHIRVQTSNSRAMTPPPRFERRDLLRELMCDQCGRDYGVYAISLFCPDCGAPNLRLHFARELVLVHMEIENANKFENQPEFAYRLLGNAHEDVLTAFEATLKTVYQYQVAQGDISAPPCKPVKNDFQNVDRAAARFAEFNLDPFACLDPSELPILKLNIQKRHIIGHNLSVIDETFAEHATEARVGETTQIIGDDIRQFANLSQRVVDSLDTWLGGAPAPETADSS
jgi:hypothetical protein